MNAAATALSPESLLDSMIMKVKDAGYELSPEVEQALRSVERHVFIPDVAQEEAYANDIVVTKRGADDQVLSCLSQPSIVGVQQGHRVLEIGAGAGYNAAVRGCQAGPNGHVTAVDVDADIVAQARERPAAAGVDNVQVELGDGALGCQPGAPYDRIIATVGACGIPDAWLAQLASAGRLVVPARIRGSVSRSIAFERDDNDIWCSVDHLRSALSPCRALAAVAIALLLQACRPGAPPGVSARCRSPVFPVVRLCLAYAVDDPVDNGVGDHAVVHGDQPSGFGE